MKTYQEIYNSISPDFYHNPKALDESQFALVKRAAIEYAKEWVIIAVALAGIDRTVEENEETIRLIEYKIDSQ